MKNKQAERVLVIGATGNVGVETLRSLVGCRDKVQIELVAGLRNGREASTKLPVRADDVVAFDFTDEKTFDAALRGVNRVLLVRPPQLADVDNYFKPFVGAMKRAGVIMQNLSTTHRDEIRL